MADLDDDVLARLRTYLIDTGATTCPACNGVGSYKSGGTTCPLCEGRGHLAGVRIGRVIASRRKALGLTQAQLGALVDRSESWVSQVERGVRRLDRMSVLQKLQEVLSGDEGLDLMRSFLAAREAGDDVG